MNSNGEGHGCISSLEIPIIHITASERVRVSEKREETEKIYDENKRRKERSSMKEAEVEVSVSNEHEEKDELDRAAELQCPRPSTKSQPVPGANLGPPLVTVKLALEPSAGNKSIEVVLMSSQASDDSSSCDYQPVLKIKKQLHFLVVDDSTLNRRMIIKLLGDHLCDQAIDGVEAVAKYAESVSPNDTVESEGTPPISSKVYDAILMDFMMPNMDGPTATESIRGMGFTGPVIGITGIYKKMSCIALYLLLFCSLRLLKFRNINLH